MTVQAGLPRWRGFHLLNMFHPKSDGEWREDDFRWICEFGFNFVAFPVCFTLWVEENDPYRLYEPGLQKLDRAVQLALEYDLNPCINIHTAPGYDVNRFVEFPYSLWKDEAALDAFCFQWTTLAERYHDFPAEKLSFHLLNEPPHLGEDVSEEEYERAMRAATEAIRKVSPDRVILCDGPGYRARPSPRLVDLGIVQCCGGYWPMGISHYMASWVGGENYPPPVWPGYVQDGKKWDRAALDEHYQPFIHLRDQGIGVLCFETGCHNKTPHEVALAWFRDVLSVLTSHGIGYVLWSFRGAFGIIDSGREDVEYEGFHGHQLDREMLSLLQEF